MADASLHRAQADEEKLSRGIAIGLPLVTLAGAAVVGVVIGPATSILVLAGGLILAVITLLWGSLRILTGDAPLPPELEALESSTQGVDALASRKKMLLRALKDLDNERSVGKIEEEDYEAISLTYRDELKVVLKRMDESLAPYRVQAEDAARLYLSREGLAGRQESSEPSTVEPDEARPDRLVCPKCKASNEIDARFCKGCASSLSTNHESTSEEPSRDAESDAGADDEDDDEA